LLQKKSNRKLLPVLVFFFFFLIFIASSGGHTDGTDGFNLFLLTENFIHKGSFTLNVNSPTALDFEYDVEKKIRNWSANYAAYQYEKNPISDVSRKEYIKNSFENANKEEFVGPWYPLLSVSAVPLYVIAQSIDVYPFTFVSFFLNSIIISLICVVTYLLGKSIFGSEKIGFVLAIIVGVTSFIWPYNSSMFARPLATLFLILCMYFIYNNKNDKTIINPFLSAIFIGLSVLSHTFFLLYTIPLFGYGIVSFRENKKKLASFLLGIIVISLVLGTINYLRFDSVADFGLAQIQEGSYLRSYGEGLYAFLISPGQSIFLYFPIALLFPLGMYRLYKKEKSFTVLLTCIIAITYFYISFGINWNTSVTWGPHRYFLSIIPLIAIPIGSLLVNPSQKLKTAIISLSAIGFIVNMIASLVWYRFAFQFSRGVADQLGVLGNFENARVWEPVLNPILINFVVLATNYVSRITSDLTREGHIYKMIIRGCNFDVMVFCLYGIVPIILLGILITVIGIVILYVLGIIGNKNTIKNEFN